MKRTFGIVPGKYKIIEIFDKLQSEIRSIGDGLDQTIVTYDKELNRVVIQQNQQNLLISSYTKNFILLMLGFTNEIKTNKDTYILKNTITNNDGTTFDSSDIRAHVENPNYTLNDYIIIYFNARYKSSMPPKLARLKEIFVYSDIIDTVLVGTTQAFMLGYFVIQTK